MELLPAGRSNSNYKLILSDGAAYVLRLYSHGSAEGETHAMDLVRNLVPVPLELDRGENWSVFSFLDGDPLQNVPQYSAAAAEALGRISSVAFDSPGWINRDGSVSAFSFVGVNGYIEEKLQDPLVKSWIGPDMSGALLLVVKKQARTLAELSAESRLVHGDFNPTNILIRDGAVSGILDWEYCHSGTHYMDIGNLLRHTLPEYHAGIKAGLEAGGMKLPRDWKKRAALVDLTSHLEFLTSGRSDSFKRQCVVRINRFLRKYP